MGYAGNSDASRAWKGVNTLVVYGRRVFISAGRVVFFILIVTKSAKRNGKNAVRNMRV